MTSSVDVLVVDDEEALRGSVSDILRGAGYSVLEAADGQSAYDILQSEHVAVVVLDQRMPRLSGTDLLRRLPAPPAVILMSAFRVSDEDRSLVNEKVFSVLLKPVAPRRLLDEVAAAYESTGTR